MSSICFVCQASLAGFDEAAATHHLNKCLDDNASGDNGNAASQEKVDTYCPVCGLAIPGNLELHVQDCLQAHGGPASGPSSGSCPCCFLDWEQIGAETESDRNVHAADCLAQQQALSEDEQEALGGRARHPFGDVAVFADGHRDGFTDREEGELAHASRFDGSLTVQQPSGSSRGFGKLRSAFSATSSRTAASQDPSTAYLVYALRALLERAFSSSHAATRSAVLCTPRVLHLKTLLPEYGWSCGYKNAQMVLSALRHVPQYRHLFRLEDGSGSGREDGSASSSSSGSVKRKSPDEEATAYADVPNSFHSLPTIQQLQTITEQAWEAGYDPEGRRHFKGKLVGSKRWIGTSEVYVMFTWLGIRSTIIDFPKATGPNKTHTALTKWVFDYFQVDLTDSPSSSSEQSNGQAGSGAKVGNAFSVLMQSNGSSIHISEDKMPLYLQHQGHSRTIVGVERTKAGDLNLLLFDPGKKITRDLASSAASLAASDTRSKKSKTTDSTLHRAPTPSLDHKQLDVFRVNLKSLSRAHEYQILRIETHGGALTAEEQRERKVIKSLVIK